ncbi:MAG: hypothetical protein ACRDTT_30330 [Pseudonocardiaceae bacterium]
MPFLVRRTGGELAEQLGDLPLALEQAASYIDQTGMGLSDYLELFRHRRDELLPRGQPTVYQGTVDTTWRLSFDRVAEASPAAAQLLELCALLAPEGISVDLLRADPALLPDELARPPSGWSDPGVVPHRSVQVQDGPVVAAYTPGRLGGVAVAVALSVGRSTSPRRHCPVSRSARQVLLGLLTCLDRLISRVHSMAAASRPPWDPAPQPAKEGADQLAPDRPPRSCSLGRERDRCAWPL